jgi:uroporphyrinogen decarboxylase
VSLDVKDVRSIVQRRGARGIPTWRSHWYNTETERLLGPQLQALRAEFPEDCVTAAMIEPGVWEAPPQVGGDYRWAISPKPVNAELREGNWTIDGVIDYGQGVLPEWDRLDDLLAHLEELDRPQAFVGARRVVQEHPGRYVIGILNHNFYDRLWKLHGVSNVMTDFHLHPQEIHQLSQGVLSLEKKWVRRYAAAGVHAIGCADDYGCQRSTLFSPVTFREFFKPLFAELCAEAHQLGLDVWLHSCGNLMPILDDLAEAGIDMLHPIQVGCFDEDWVARELTGKMGFHLGMDVQHLMVEAPPQEVARVCRERLARFRNPCGGLAVGAGNAIMPETPLDNIRAFHETIREFREGGSSWA